ncbi:MULTISPECIES: Dps family protein [Auritidibacter]|uniref:Dps family protein n=1 Tax=Auritidibacter TaxID=1160973 RepID=UPI000D7351E9|nr:MULTISPECIES: DNA starvation/stationary phase protection protein [Auritidibacter]PXA79641.1 DNA starvation/stationary phase protection protein [Auritidibacter sp. NML120779]NIH71279.1 starvation-inducible DNA-binding protein [Auritidibacter ignavus]PXA81062.1 DNA starvation/stationary phase protection protein [Auritidibacter sp. NML120636]RMX23540.1 DNA starvation/stationary phase protection protein [Auritidibacter ignavus]WGH81409.1 DNA starvation/stationary phase protection protein [Aurit
MTEANANYTTPGLEVEEGHRVAEVLQTRLHAMNDLQLTLKQAHWNVVGRDFISVHEMLDPQIDLVRDYADTLAERIATLGVAPKGTPGAIVSERTWEDYSLLRGSTLAHISALDEVYTGIIADLRAAISEVGKVDPMSEDILIEQARGLELFHWFLRSFITSPEGDIEHVQD